MWGGEVVQRVTQQHVVSPTARCCALPSTPRSGSGVQVVVRSLHQTCPGCVWCSLAHVQIRSFFVECPVRRCSSSTIDDWTSFSRFQESGCSATASLPTPDLLVQAAREHSLLSIHLCHLPLVGQVDKAVNFEKEHSPKPEKNKTAGMTMVENSLRSFLKVHV